MRSKRKIYQRLELNKILSKSIMLVFSLVLVSTYISSSVMAKYKSESQTSDSARVAKFGELSFSEYTTDGNQVSGDTAQVETITVIAGENVTKKVSLSFSGSEVASYIFLVIETNGWSITTNEDNTVNRLSIKNAGKEDMVYWNLSNNWTYLEDGSDDTHFVFYHLLDANTEFEEDVMTELEVHAISLDDVNLLKSQDYSLSFKSYALSATGATPLEAWTHISS